MTEDVRYRLKNPEMEPNKVYDLPLDIVRL